MPRRDESGEESTDGEHESDFLVVVASEMRDDILTHHPTQRVLQLRQLNEEIVLGIEARSNLRTLVVEAQPFLDATESGALGLEWVMPRPGRACAPVRRPSGRAT